MKKRDILDLRMIIAAFFTLVGVLLLIVSFVMKTEAGKTETVNRWSGVFYIIFGVIMYFLWRHGSHEDEHQ